MDIERLKIQIVVYEAVGYRIHVEDVLLRHGSHHCQSQRLIAGTTTTISASLPRQRSEAAVSSG